MVGKAGHPVAHAEAPDVRKIDQRLIGRTNGFYNGWGTAERQGSLARVRAAIAAGVLAIPERCSVCQRDDKPIGWHSERYDVLDVYPVCRGCHIRIHARFRYPKRWREFISRLGPGWYQNLSIDARSLTRAYAITYPSAVRQDWSFDGLGSPPIFS